MVKGSGLTGSRGDTGVSRLSAGNLDFVKLCKASVLNCWGREGGECLLKCRRKSVLANYNKDVLICVNLFFLFC